MGHQLQVKCPIRSGLPKCKSHRLAIGLDSHLQLNKILGGTEVLPFLCFKSLGTQELRIMKFIHFNDIFKSSYVKIIENADF